MSLTLAPCTIADARRFVGIHHRHNLPPKVALFALAADEDGERVAVAIVGRPVARLADDGQTVEVVRLCSVGTRNACSFLYGAACRAAKALGYRRVITYTLQSEPGASLRAAGFTEDARLKARKGWDTPSRPRVTYDLFGNERAPLEAKIRWVREVA